MTFTNFFSTALILFFFMVSCEKEIIEKSNMDAETETLTLENNSLEDPKETVEEVTKRMRQKTIEFFKLTGEPTPSELISENAASFRSSYSAYNSGRISDNYPSFPYNNYHQLNFGTRRGTTQWVSLTLNNNYVNTVQDGYTNDRPGQLNFYLRGVEQTVSLNFAINVATQVAVITPTTTASLHSRQIPNTSFTLSSPLSITIHSNTNGWMWVEIKKAGTVVFSSLYRYTYNTSLGSRNGGNIHTSKFVPIIGPRPPYSSAGFTTQYLGYCGWF